MTSSKNIPVFKPFLDDSEQAAAKNVLDIGWLGMGKNVSLFESRLDQMLCLHDVQRRSVAVSTGHAALHIALLLIDIKPGDEVITPSFNNIADFQAILACGGKPVFCDVRDDTLWIELEKADCLINKHTKALIVTDYGSQLCEHEKIQALAKKYNIRVIHDAAHSFGSKYKGQYVGRFSDITMFSFDPVKSITCIDGGALILNSEREVQEAHEIRLVGMTQPASTMYENKRAWTYDVARLGFRYHMANMHAAIGVAQLDKFEIIKFTRNETCLFYNNALKDISSIKLQQWIEKDVLPFMYYIRVDKSVRDSLRNHLFNVGVDNGIHWQPGHWFKLLKNCDTGDLSVTNKIAEEIITLPLHSGMSIADKTKVIESIKTFYK